jgi:transposase
MLRKEDFAVIKALQKRGVYLKDIADDLGVHPKTVSRALKRDGSPRRSNLPRGSKLDAYKPFVDHMISEGVWNAVVILRELEARGYDGGITILREYIQPRRSMRASKATVRFETEAGEQLQTDWGQIITEVGGQALKIYFIVNTLGYSRRFHFWCTDSEDAEHTYEGLIRSLEYFGGVPQEVLVDNQKSAVRQVRQPGQAASFNERFLDLAGQYGFTPRACRPYRARTKGKDERMVSYIKHHFFVRYRTFESMVHMNQMAESWLATEADQRVHGTVKEVVAERFEREKPALGPLPAHRYDTAYLEQRQVAWDAYIEVRGNRYSVPAELAGQTVTVRIGLDDRLRVYRLPSLAPDEPPVAIHSLQQAPNGWVTVPEHHAELWKAVGQVEQRSLQVYEEVMDGTEPSAG